jgi:hypothetical protein
MNQQLSTFFSEIIELHWIEKQLLEDLVLYGKKIKKYEILLNIWEFLFA